MDRKLSEEVRCMDPLWLLIIVPASSCIGFVIAALLAAGKDKK